MKKLFSLTMFLFVALALNAQTYGAVYADETDRDTSATAVRTTWISSKPGDHWFISAQVGIADLQSEETRYLGFSDRVNFPTFGLSVGRWMSPVWGLRMNVTAAKLQGFATWNNDLGLGDWYVGKNYPNPNISSNTTNNYVHAFDQAGAQFVKNTYLDLSRPMTTDQGPGYMYDFKYAAASFDFLLNLKNLCYKYNEDAVFNPIIYGGIGFAHTFKETNPDRTAVNSIMEKFGLMLDFRLSDHWSVNLDGQVLILPEIFDRRVGDGNSQDGVFNYTLGVTYKIGNHKFQKAQLYSQAQIDSLNARINELQLRPEFCPECPPVVPCPECPPCPEVKPIVVPAPAPIDVNKVPVVKDNLRFLPTPVFFKINSSVVNADQMKNIQIAVDFLNENPDAKMKLTGYADKQTGNAAINKRLSEARSKSVYDILTKKYKINPNRLKTDFLGDDFQPFAENDWNRVVIFVVED